MLTCDENYIPAEAYQDDELFLNGIFEWNITKIIDYIERNNDSLNLSDVSVSDYISYANINEEHVDSVDPSIPLILAEINKGRYIVIDGNHRLTKAYREGIEYLQAYKLDVNQHIKFLTSISSYKTFVEYWNEKLKRK